MFTVYLITNLINGKMYVGQTRKTALQRFQEHCWVGAKKDYFHFAIEKHGKENFVVDILGTYETSDQVNLAECTWILLLRTWDRKIGYNSTFGGEHGATPTDEVKQILAEKATGRLHSLETKQQMSEDRKGENNPFFGKTHDPETIETARQKLKISHAGEGNYWFGKTFTEEHRASLSQTRKGKPRATPMSAETRAKLSALAQARWDERRSNPDSTRSIGKPVGPRSKPLVV